jgi:hypothetical protein
MSTIKFVCHDDYNERTVKFSTTLQRENIDGYIDAFRQFLAALEFHPDTINRALGEDDARS